ncbi:hypothetical protein FLAG1_11350 [Fusarium langsethiae]|uniref:Uncharacterized protein n=1 Tax=Fusarium langsethiae TaxID=179993 RepID=A0A0N0DAW4_FUSLA|nr:hypothetical protein FLAG1_11350 [Fusarium langsethiae]GKU09541.1 unnamed protein product [Fusarium langsethiae]
MPIPFNPDKQFLFRVGCHSFPVEWDTLRTWPKLLEACEEDQLDLFKFMELHQAFCCIRIIKSETGGAEDYPPPKLEPTSCPIEHACDLFTYHFKIYEFAARYEIGTLHDLSFHYLKLAADQMSFPLLAGTLSKLNHDFSEQEQTFIQYMEDRAKMVGETITTEDHALVQEDWQFSQTLENFLIDKIVIMQMEIQQLKAAVATNNDESQ